MPRVVSSWPSGAHGSPVSDDTYACRGGARRVTPAGRPTAPTPPVANRPRGARYNNVSGSSSSSEPSSREPWESDASNEDSSADHDRGDAMSETLGEGIGGRRRLLRPRATRQRAHRAGQASPSPVSVNPRDHVRRQRFLAGGRAPSRRPIRAGPHPSDRPASIASTRTDPSSRIASPSAPKRAPHPAATLVGVPPSNTIDETPTGPRRRARRVRLTRAATEPDSVADGPARARRVLRTGRRRRPRPSHPAHAPRPPRGHPERRRRGGNPATSP